MTSRSPGKAAETAARRSAAKGAAAARSGLSVQRGAQPVATKSRNSSLLGRPRCSALCCSSLTPTSCHGAFGAAPPLCDSCPVSLITPTPSSPRSSRVAGRSLRERAGQAVRDSAPPADCLGGWCSTGVLRAVVIDPVPVSGSDRWVWLVNVLACTGFRVLCEPLVGAHRAGGRVWESHL